MDRYEYWDIVDSYNPEKSEMQNTLECRFVNYIVYIMSNCRYELNRKIITDIVFLCFLYDLNNKFGVLNSLKFNIYNSHNVENTVISELFDNDGDIRTQPYTLNIEEIPPKEDKLLFTEFNSLICELTSAEDRIETLIHKVVISLKSQSHIEVPYTVNSENTDLVNNFLDHPLIRKLWEIV